MFFKIYSHVQYRDGESSRNVRWNPKELTSTDRQLARALMLRCFRYLQTNDLSVFWRVMYGNTFVRVKYGNKYLGEIGARRRRELVKMLAAKMRRLLAAGKENSHE